VRQQPAVPLGYADHRASANRWGRAACARGAVAAATFAFFAATVLAYFPRSVVAYVFLSLLVVAICALGVANAALGLRRDKDRRAAVWGLVSSVIVMAANLPFAADAAWSLWRAYRLNGGVIPQATR